MGQTNDTKSLYAVLTVVISIALWSFYLLFAIYFLPTSYLAEEGTARAIVRVLVVLMPAVVYLYKFEDESFLDFTWLRQNWPRGLTVGCLISGIFSLPTLYQIIVLEMAFSIPSGLGIWLNWIIGSPFAEEVLFRGLLFQALRRSFNPIWAAIVSAALFTLLHVPWWLWTMTTDVLIIRLATIFVYGLLFAFLMWLGKSLWSAILPHWVNNFLAWFFV